MSFSSISIATADHGGRTPLTTVHPDIIQSHILKPARRPTLAATSCASASCLSLCNDDYLWKDICNSTWPSTADHRVRAAISAFPSGHRSFYSDAFPALRHQSNETPHRRHRDFSDTPELISAVDIYYDEKLIYSKVLVTETNSTWFLCTPLRLDLLDQKETVATPSEFSGGGAWMARAEEHLRVSWILIDPVGRRAVNVASRRAVAARWHWLTGDVQLRFAVVEAAGSSGGELVECAVVVSCRGSEDGEVRVREVSMQVEDMEGRILTGMDSLVILQAAMAEQRMKRDGKTERDIYEIFSRMKAQCRERKQRREKGLDTVCIATGISIFFAFFLLFLSK
ncbi:F-box protein at2g27310 [Phtheirospermum japonicum]|uniref:F-box protein at2g27310 n=1 Tax=Phtheirospermum japonicum TaxID=374723 RepID=A0A830BW63_9LAMI|nr:F-box protein at2g27310 [Phtheirospermum japonicum]